MKGKACTPRQRRKYRIKNKLGIAPDGLRLSVFKSDRFTYAQVISDLEGKTLVSASTKEEEVVSGVGAHVVEGKTSSTKSVAAAKSLGAVIARRCNEKGISKVVFDRNGFFFHGRVKAVADGAREAGLEL